MTHLARNERACTIGLRRKDPGPEQHAMARTAPVPVHALADLKQAACPVPSRMARFSDGDDCTTPLQDATPRYWEAEAPALAGRSSMSTSMASRISASVDR